MELENAFISDPENHPIVRTYHYDDYDITVNYCFAIGEKIPRVLIHPDYGKAKLIEEDKNEFFARKLHKWLLDKQEDKSTPGVYQTVYETPYTNHSTLNEVTDHIKFTLSQIKNTGLNQKIVEAETIAKDYGYITRVQRFSNSKVRLDIGNTYDDINNFSGRSVWIYQSR